ncbi:hypothetical protein N7499_008973 [Penicillium canescens]|nr:hypothetical protein N7499_008973 [Penicillium canescens]
MALPCLAWSRTGRIILCGVQLWSEGLVQGDFDAVHQEGIDDGADGVKVKGVVEGGYGKYSME